MTVYLSNALLASSKSDIQDSQSSLRLTTDVKTYSKTPKTVLRQLRAEGLPPCACFVYWAIADRQRHAKGEYFRSNKDLADEVQLSVSSVQNAIRLLIDAGYLSKWFNKNGGRRMQIKCKGVQPLAPQSPTTSTPPSSQLDPYKDNKIKITTSTACVFSDSDKALLGGQLDKLVTKYGEDSVRVGLDAWKATDQSRVDNTIGWITDAIKYRYPARPAKAAKFPESVLEQEKIVEDYAGLSPENANSVNELLAEFETKNGYKGGTSSIAAKIFNKGKL